MEALGRFLFFLQNSPKRQLLMIRKYLLLQFFWVLAVLASLVYNINAAYQETLKNDSVAAEATVNRDISFRSWAAKKGGVYVFANQGTDSNPYLVHPLKDLTTQEGIALTLLNPAYLIRDLQEHSVTELGIKTRLISRNPINPKNQADPWEEKILASFTNQKEPITELVEVNNQAYFKSIHPFYVKAECLSCHAHQGYKVGEVRGGIAASVLLEPYLANYNSHKYKLLLTHSGVALLGFIGLFASYSREKKNSLTQEKHLQELQLAATVFEQSYDAIIITDQNGIIVDLNNAFERISGYTKAELVGKKPSLLKSTQQDAETYQEIKKALAYKGHWQGELWSKKSNGEPYAVILSVNTIYNEKFPKEITNYLAVAADITHIKDNEKQLQYLAHYDTLTNLPNERLITQQLRQAIIQADAQNTQLAVVYFDLDSFKKVNDKYGHETGDQLLIELTKRIKRLLKPEDLFGRLSGDEFILVFTQLENIQQSTALLNELLATIAKRSLANDEIVKVTASLGVTYYPQDPSDTEQLIRHADQAMYAAKQQGKNCFEVFDPQLDLNLRNLSTKAKEVQKALDNNEFELYYQPKINSQTNQVIGAEALIRWNHPVKGLLAPGLFLPDISNHTIMQQVSYWVMQNAAKQLNEWQQAGINCPISINMDSNLLHDPDFINNLKQVFIDYPHLNPNNLEIEVLENIAVDDLEKTSQVLLQIRKQGVLISIDDFGTGYSSLSYLKHLPVNTLKIDQSFVRNLIDDADDLAIVKGVISMADTFKLAVIAEGVETQQHGLRLQELGCKWVQGYGISRPLPKDQFLLWLEQWNNNAQWLN